MVKIIIGMKPPINVAQIDVLMIVNVMEKELVHFGDGVKETAEAHLLHQFHQSIVKMHHIVMMNLELGMEQVNVKLIVIVMD